MTDNSKLWMGLHRRSEGTSALDVAVIGVPYDGSVSHERGAAEAPDVLRDLSADAGPWTEDLVRFADLRLRDFGDVAIDDDDEDATQAAIARTVRGLATDRTVVCALGGDHSITSATVAGLQHRGPLGILWFDAHADVMDTFQGIRGRRLSRWNHACALRRICELPNVSSEGVLVVGARDLLPDEVRYIRERNLNVIYARELPSLSPAALVDRITGAFTNVPLVYASFDIDVLDPACAPGTGVPIPGGITTRYLLNVLQKLADTCRVPPDEARRFPPITGFDIVEVSPPADVQRLTALAARSILSQMFGLIAVQSGVATDILAPAD
jgi:agmatinase